ncbi:MAG: hypothetical protein Ta2B_17470 [Termitinemataceae bacterium]|nr:MAG: hypothetical protein Ta2B_17470 [Termitinemataceae bacterium]
MALLRNVNSAAGTQDKNSVKLTIKDIPLGDIIVRENVRKDYAGIEELAASIKQHGLLQPITVYTDGDQYVVKTGHRRFKALQLLYKQEPDRFHSIRCIISDATNLAVIQLVENVQREDLSQIDLFNGLSTLREQGMSAKEVAQTIGKSESYIKFLFMGVNEIKKTPELKEAVSIANLTLQDIVETRGIPDTQERLEILEQRVKGQIGRDEMRAKVKELKQSSTITSGSESSVDAPEIKDDAAIPESNLNAAATVIYNVSPDGLTLLLGFSDTGLIKKIEPALMKVLEEADIQIVK